METATEIEKLVEMEIKVFLIFVIVSAVMNVGSDNIAFVIVARNTDRELWNSIFNIHRVQRDENATYLYVTLSVLKT